MVKNIVLIGNPIAGGGAEKNIKKAAAILEGRGCNVRLMLTTKKGDAESFAKEIVSEFRVKSQEFKNNKNAELLTHNSKLLVIAAGGDGTYNEVANGLVHSDIPMAILPLGTTSVLAKELNIPEDLEAALDIALHGKAQTIHLGRIMCNTPNSKPLTRYFLLMAGIGFDGEAVFGVSERIKKYSGKGAYILSGIKTLLNYNPEPITINAQIPPTPPFTKGGEGGLLKVAGYTAIIGKASCYGGNFKITPDARLTDPYFYVFATHKKSRLALLRYVIGIIKGFHLNFKDTAYFKAKELSIEGNAHIQIDGDYLGVTPAKIEIVPDALKLIMPK